jgi:hypothetical protein
MGAKKAESELGSFDCVHAEHGKAPSVGKVTIFKTSLVFKAEMFGLDNTTLSIKRRDLDAVVGLPHSRGVSDWLRRRYVCASSVTV